MFEKILVANRGEVALRIMRAARECRQHRIHRTRTHEGACCILSKGAISRRIALQCLTDYRATQPKAGEPDALMGSLEG